MNFGPSAPRTRQRTSCLDSNSLRRGSSIQGANESGSTLKVVTNGKIRLVLAAEKFVSLVFDKRYDEAEAILREHRGAVSGDQIPRLVGVEEALRTKIGQLGSGPNAQ